MTYDDLIAQFYHKNLLKTKPTLKELRMGKKLL